MKIFGLEITRAKKKSESTVQPLALPPAVTEPVNLRIVDAKSISQIAPLVPVTLKFAQRTGARGIFLAPEYDLTEIGVIQDTDSYVRQAFKKKLGLMFKEGYHYTGPNKETVQYIKTRMAQIARASNVSQVELLKNVADCLIRVSNAFIVKVRNPAVSGGKTYRNAKGKMTKPIAGYFVAAPETMSCSLSDAGKVVRWKQELPDGTSKEWLAEDVIHFTIDRREGFLFGVPSLVPVIDDIRALRQIEENVELLLYQHLFPLFQYKVGTDTIPAGYTEDGRKEIDVVKEQIKLMPLEGGIITPGHHEIQAVGAEGRAIRAEGYLTHFKKRVFAGLGISAIDVGEGDTTNKATAFTLSRALVDSVKDLQDSFEAQWDQQVISELLLESTFGEDVLDESNMVHLTFKEIDIQNKVDLEKHYIEVFKVNGLTYDEFRNELGREPIHIPEDPEDQDPTKYPEWFNTYWKLFEEPLSLIRAVDEPFSLAAQEAANARSLSLTQKAIQTGRQAAEKQRQVEAEEDRVTKVAVAKARPRPTTKDHFLGTVFSQLEHETEGRMQQSLASRRVVDFELLTSHARTWAADAAKQLTATAFTRLVAGFNDVTGGYAPRAPLLLNSARTEVQQRIEKYVTRLAVQTIALLKRRVANSRSQSDIEQLWAQYLEELRLAFESTRYRTDFIFNTELTKAYNLGQALGLRWRYPESAIQIQASAECCEMCRTRSTEVLSVQYIDIDVLPPIHPGCECQLRVVGVPTEDMVQDGHPSKLRTARCPECLNTIFYSEDTGRYYCKHCSKGFDSEDVVEDSPQQEDGAKMERCVAQVKKSLRKRYPGKSEKAVTSSAWAICNAQLKGKS